MRFPTPARLALTLALLLLAAPHAGAMPSLDPKDMMELSADVQVGMTTYKATFTILRDTASFTDYYYLPGTPMLAEKDGVPEFTILKFQDREKENREKLIEGGFLQFACSLDIPERTRESLKSSIASEMKSKVASVSAEIAMREKIFAEKKAKDKDYKMTPIDAQMLEDRRVWVEAVKNLRDSAISLKRIPFKKSEVQMYKPTDLGGTMIGSVFGPSIAPNFAGAKMPFSLMLKDKLAVNVFDAMTTKGATGVPVIVNYTFTGLTPPLGFNVVVDWDMCFQHFSADANLRIAAGKANVQGAVNGDYTYIREKLETNKAMQIQITADPEAFPREEINKMITPIIDRISRELLEAMKPETVSPAKAKDDYKFDPNPKITPSQYPQTVPIVPPVELPGVGPVTIGTSGTGPVDLAKLGLDPRTVVGSGRTSTGGAAPTGSLTPTTQPQASTAPAPAGGGGLTPTPPAQPPAPFKADVGVGFAIKDVKKVRKGKEVINYELRQVIERTSTAGGFIGVGAYPEKVRENCIVVVERGGFESAFLVLPEVGTAVDEMGIEAIDLTVTPVKPDGTKDDKQTARWTPKTAGWQFNGVNRKMLAFPLQDLFKKFGADKMNKQAKFDLEFQFFFKDGKSFTSTQTVPMFTGDFPAAAPLNNVLPVRIRFDGLTFRNADPDFTLEKVKVDLASGGRTYVSDWLGATDAGEVPKPLVWFVKDGDPVTAKVQFQYKDIQSDKRRLTHNWRFNGLDLTAPRALEQAAVTDAQQKSHAEATTKKLDAAKAVADEDDRTEAYVDAIKFWMRLPDKVANAKAGEQAIEPLSLDVTLEDARLADTVHSNTALDTGDDKDAFVEFVRLIVRDKKRLSRLELRGYANRVLWFKYNPDDYRDQ